MRQILILSLAVTLSFTPSAFAQPEYEEDSESWEETSSEQEESTSEYETDTEEDEAESEAEEEAEEEEVGAGDPAADERFWAVRFGGDLGFAQVETVNYYVANIVGLARVGPLRADLWAPLLFAVDGFEFRKENWDQSRDFNRIARCVRLDIGDYETRADVPGTEADCEPWGSSLHSDRVYFNLRMSPIESSSLGNRTLVSEFRNSEDLDRPALGGRTDFFLMDKVYGQFLMDSISDPGVLAGRLAIRPFQLFFGDKLIEVQNRMEIGFTTASDLQAPLHLQTAFGQPLLDSNGDLRFTRQSHTAIGVDFHYLHEFGLDSEELEDYHGIFAYADYNRFVDVAYADGLHAGARYDYQHPTLDWEFQTGAEFQLVGNRYMSGYFDSSYVTRSKRFALTDTALEIEGVTEQTTMLEYMLSRPTGYAYGFEWFFNVAIPIPVSADETVPLPISGFIEGTSRESSWSAGLTIGPFEMDQAIIFAQYIRRNFDGFEGIVKANGSLIRVRGRFFLGKPERMGTEEATFLDMLYIDATYDHRFYQNALGLIRPTDDFAITMGFATGVGE